MSKKFWSFKKNPSPAMKVDKSELKKRLTPMQYRVTQEAATERPFSGEYLRLKDNGMYACIVCGEELFSSTCKYESGCGWPAFYDTEDENRLIYKPDLSHVGGNLLLLALKPDLVRTEVTCGNCGSHLGHVFDDGPKPTGKRYCINSASLKFKQVNSCSNNDSERQDDPKRGKEGHESVEGNTCTQPDSKSPDKRLKDVIKPVPDKTVIARSGCSSSKSGNSTNGDGNIVLIPSPNSKDHLKAVKQSDATCESVIYREGTLSSSIAPTQTAAGGTSVTTTLLPASSLTPAAAATSTDVAYSDANDTDLKSSQLKKISSDRRMRFFTSQRDEQKYRNDVQKVSTGIENLSCSQKLWNR